MEILNNFYNKLIYFGSKNLMFNKKKFLETRNKTIIWPGNPIYPEKIIIQKHTCTPIFTEAIFAIVRTWKEPTCPMTGEWIKKLWYIYTKEYDSAIKRTKLVKNSDANEARICHTEWSQKNKISRRFSWPRDWTRVSCIAGRHFTIWATREVTVSETQVQSLGWEDLLEKEKGTHSTILAWEIPRTEEPGEL